MFVCRLPCDDLSGYRTQPGSHYGLRVQAAIMGYVWAAIMGCVSRQPLWVTCGQPLWVTCGQPTHAGTSVPVSLPAHTRDAQSGGRDNSVPTPLTTPTPLTPPLATPPLTPPGVYNA